MADHSDISSKPGSSGWHIALERASAQDNYLGDPAVVETVVRHFLAGVVTRYAHVAGGGLKPADAAAQDGAECERMARIFAGQDPDYQPVGHWNGEGLADALRHDMDERLSGDAELDDLAAITEAFAVMVHLVYDVLRAMPVGSGEVDEGAKKKLEAVVGYAVRVLTGTGK